MGIGEMVTVDVRLCASLTCYIPQGYQSARFMVTLEDESDIACLIDSLGLPKEEVGFVVINDKPRHHDGAVDLVLKDMDKVEIYPHICGG